MAATPESAKLFMSGLIERARKLKKTIAFPEGTDPRVLEAAARLAREGIVKPVLIGAAPANAPDGVKFIDPAKSPALGKYAALYYERRRAKGITQVEAAASGTQAALLRFPDGGRGRCRWQRWAAPSTAPPIPCARRCMPSGRTRAHGWFRASSLWRCADLALGHNGLMAFADCAVVMDPTAIELADIAIATAESTRVLINAEPAVALLTFSTKGSGKGKEPDKVMEALRNSAGARAGNERGWRTAGRRGGGCDGGQVQSAWVESGGPRQYAGISHLVGGQHRVQTGGAVGRRDGDRAVHARAGEAGQRSVARLFGGRHFQRRGGDGASIRVSIAPAMLTVPAGLFRTLRPEPGRARLSLQEIQVAPRPHVVDALRGRTKISWRPNPPPMRTCCWCTIAEWVSQAAQRHPDLSGNSAPGDPLLAADGGSVLAGGGGHHSGGAPRAGESGIGFNVGGGFHHAFAGHGEGFCAINDIAVAIRRCSARGPCSAPWWWIATCTTATARPRFSPATPRSSRCPSTSSTTIPAKSRLRSLDIHLADGIGDAEYLHRLGNGYRAALTMFQPELLIVYVAGRRSLL